MYHRVVPADHVQPSPDRPGRHGDVRAAVPRSVQLQLRSARSRSQLDLVGAAMHSRFAAEGQAGRDEPQGLELLDLVERRPADDGLLPQHDRPAHRDDRQPDADRASRSCRRSSCRTSNLHFPIEPQEWHFRQSIDYSVTANCAVLDIASRNKENFLFNIYQMGKNSIERGSRDSWTTTPRRVIAAQAARRRRARRRGGDGAGGDEPDAAAAAAAARRRAGGLQDAAARPGGARSARLHPAVRSAGLPDRDQVRQRAAQDRRRRCTARRRRSPSAGKNYPAGSYVVKAAQAFRPHVLDMFEPQDHPDDIPYPGGPPTPPVRQRRLDARVSDGREVRSHPRRLRRAVREAERPAEAGAGQGHGDGDRGLYVQPRGQRRVHRGQPAAGRRAKTCPG